MKEMVIDATLENLDSVINFISAELEENSCDMRIETQINIAVEEIYVNIAHYAYNPAIGAAKIRVEVSSEAVIIEFEDNGKPYNPLEKIDPDITASADERDIGGLGIFMVKKIMDCVEYKHSNNKNILTIKKEFTT